MFDDPEQELFLSPCFRVMQRQPEKHVCRILAENLATTPFATKPWI